MNFSDFHISSYIYIYLYWFSRISIDFYCFSWIWFERFWGQTVGRPLTPCGSPWPPVTPNRSGYRFRYILISQIMEVWIWRLDALKDWNGLGEVTEVMALRGEGIGTNSNTFGLQERGGLVPKFFASRTPLNAILCKAMWCKTNGCSTK